MPLGSVIFHQERHQLWLICNIITISIFIFAYNPQIHTPICNSLVFDRDYLNMFPFLMMYYDWPLEGIYVLICVPKFFYLKYY